jgi:hypothetical protein
MNQIQNKVSDPSQITMTLEEARKVMWLSTNCRPLGELFDEGYLTQARLIWAVENAYDKRIRQASKVLLEWSRRPTKPVSENKNPIQPPQIAEQPIQVEMSIEQARSTLWPLPPYKGQMMGTLSESKQITLKDLGFAIENAWDVRVRRAAIALLLIRLKQAVKEPTPKEFPHVISGGRSYSERQIILLTYLEGSILGGLLVGAIMAFIFASLKKVPPQSGKSFSSLVSTPTGIIALIIVLGLVIALFWLANFLADRLVTIINKKIDNHRLGKEGEDRTIEMIQQSLDGSWYLFRNVVLPGRNKGDLDGILVGPLGVWVLEIKNLNGEYRNIEDRWEYRRGKKWKSANTNPSRQAENNAIRLSSFFKADNIRQWITPAVVWANSGNPLSVQNPSTAVWLLDRLPDELGNLSGSKPIPNERQAIIVDKLTKLCDQQSIK